MIKKILITGANSYIGTSFETYVNKHYPKDFQVDTVDMVDGTWREKDFSPYDVIFHVAGIAHADTKKITEAEKQKYYDINTNLTIETAKKAKAEGVKQFIYMSSIIVYGESAKIGEKKVITQETIPKPANFYGDSKLKAEEGIRQLCDDTFKVIILRPPMIYGKGSKGNYPKLAKMAKTLPAFPYIDNERSMLYIENLCEFIVQRINAEDTGTFFPQNTKYVNTSNLVKLIAKAHGKDIKIVPGFSSGLTLAGQITELANKAFGSLIYDKSMSGNLGGYNVATFGQSIARTEKNNQKHILVVSQYFYPEPFRINDICKEWINRGYKVTVVTGIPNYPEGKFYDGYSLSKKRNELWEGIEIIRLPIIPRCSNAIALMLNYASFVISGAFWKEISKINADLVFVFEVSPMTQALPAVWYAKKKGVPCFLYVQDLWPENVEIIAGISNEVILAELGKMVDYIYKHCQLIFATSESFIKKIQQRGVEEGKLVYWPQYAEDYLKPINNEKKLNCFTVTFTGNIGKGQGLKILPQTALALKEKYPEKEILFCIVGDGRCKETLMEQVKEKQVEEYFNFVDRKAPEDIPEVLGKCDCALLCLAKNSIFEMTIPAKLQTYMACGKPIIASVAGESKRIIEEANCGVCVEIGNAEALADVINQVSGFSNQKIEKLGNNAFRYSKEYFNKKKLMDQMDYHIQLGKVQI